VDIDGNNTLQVNVIGVTISTFETLPILFPDEGHGFRKIPNRIRSIVEPVRFFKEHLGAAGE